MVLKEMEKELETKVFEKVQQQLLLSQNEMKQEMLLKVRIKIKALAVLPSLSFSLFLILGEQASRRESKGI